MAIIVNGVDIPTSGNNISFNGESVDEVVYNGITVWKRELGIPIADWNNPESGWHLPGSGDDSCIADIYLQTNLNNSEDCEEVVSPLFSTSLYTKFSFTGRSYYTDMDGMVPQVCYSNDGTSWTDWIDGNGNSVDIDNTYTYAKVRIYFFARDTYDGEETGYGYYLESMTFHNR